jgi:hypothetical protein
MRVDSPSGEWRRFLSRFVPLLAVLLWPWPAIGHFCAEAFADGGQALVGLVVGEGAEVRFVASHYEPEHPFWVQMLVKNAFTGQSFELPVDTRTVVYLRIAVFLALALAWPVWKTRRGARATAWGFALLLATIVLSVALPLLQVLGMVSVLPLGALTQSVISIGILTLVTYPSMAFAIPGLFWVLTLRLARATPASDLARQGEGTSAQRNAALSIR